MENLKIILDLISHDMLGLYAIWTVIGLTAIPVLFWVEKKL